MGAIGESGEGVPNHSGSGKPKRVRRSSKEVNREAIKRFVRRQAQIALIKREGLSNMRRLKETARRLSDI